MSNKSEKYYNDRLQRYFDRHYIEFSETAEFYVNPAVNKWKFIIPELGFEVILTCNDIGWVVEKRNKI